jgi:S1-C subfamily serine protease
MANKVITGVLILLVILIGGAGYYSYTLSQQIADLGQRLTTFEMEQQIRVDAIVGEITTLQTETMSNLNTLEGRIGETRDNINTLEEELSGVASQLDTLEKRFDDAFSGLSRATIDANEVYQKVSQAAVRISNGQNTVGSGLIYDNQGHVVTANHVVDELSEIYIILPDGKVSKATILGYSEASDIAILTLEDNPAIEPPPLADSSQVRVGEPVVALGSPLNIRDTLTGGIVSQVNRLAEIPYNTQSRWISNLFQFDAAVNYGNSGCPLANARGEIIGIVIARVQPAEGDGICYAVSANKVKRIASAIISKGYYDYPWIGVSITNLTPQIVLDRALKSANGVLVAAIISGSPAEDAGIKVDDIIVSIDGISARDDAEFTSYLGEFKSPGDTAKIGIIRGTEELELSIEVGKRPE